MHPPAYLRIFPTVDQQNLLIDAGYITNQRASVSIIPTFSEKALRLEDELCRLVLWPLAQEGYDYRTMNTSPQLGYISQSVERDESGPPSTIGTKRTHATGFPAAEPLQRPAPSLRDQSSYTPIKLEFPTQSPPASSHTPVHRRTFASPASYVLPQSEMSRSVMGHFNHMELAGQDTDDHVKQLEAELKEAKADLEKAKSQLQVTTADLAKAKAEIQEGKDEAKKDLQEAKAEIQEAKAEAKKEIRKTKTDITKAKSETEKAKAEIQEARAELRGAMADLREAHKRIREQIQSMVTPTVLGGQIPDRSNSEQEHQT